MHSIKCNYCGHSVEVEDIAKKYRLAFFFIFLGIVILVYERNAISPSLVITISGVLSAASGLVWMVITRFRSNRN